VTARVLEGLPALAALEPAWRALATPARFFTAPDWTLAWLAARAAEGTTPHAIALRDARGALSGLLPLARTARGDLETCGAREGAAHVDVIAAPGREADVAARVLDVLSLHRGGRVRLHRLASEGALARAVASGGDRVPALVRAATTCPYVSLERGWDGHLAALPKHERHETRRHVRRFFERPGAAARFASWTDEVEPGLDALFSLHERRFRALGRPSAFARPPVRAFHDRLARALCERGDLLLATLEDGDATVAAVYGFHAGDTTYLFQTGIDPAFRPAGAGVALRARVLEEAVAGAGRREADLLDGCYDWKARIASGVRVLLDADLFPGTALGRGERLLERAMRAARARAGAVVRGRRPCPGRAAGHGPDAATCARTHCPFARDA
jgi:CelD/BcsL family acetyltransferase involved in cellulose biosynthesis